MKYRTDLAIESKEMLEQEGKEKKVEIPGVEVYEDHFGDHVKVTRIKVADEYGSNVMGKPIGTYVTMEIEDIEDEEDRKDEAAKALSGELKRLIKFHSKLKVLVIGLGNDKITPDALGPITVSKIKVTRHIFLAYGATFDDQVGCVSALAPGVMATTGMETAELIKGAVDIVRPEVIIAIDALAARSIERISTTIQVTDTGISPGSGTGNMRKDITEKALGARVVAIGVPTVIDSKTLILDSLAGYIKKPKEVRAYLEKAGEDMIVTTTNIDQIIDDYSTVISNGINSTLLPGIYSS